MNWNDDDFYVYWLDTLKVAAHYGSKNPRPVPLPGQAVTRGMSAKRLGLIP